MKNIYFNWLSNHSKIYEYNSGIIYSIGERVTIGDSIYESLSDNNQGNYPVDSRHWMKLV